MTATRFRWLIAIAIFPATTIGDGIWLFMSVQSGDVITVYILMTVIVAHSISIDLIVSKQLLY